MSRGDFENRRRGSRLEPFARKQAQDRWTRCFRSGEQRPITVRAPENEEAAKSRNETRQIEKERKTAVKTEAEEERTEGSEERGNLEKPTTYFQLISVLTDPEDPENRAK